MSHHDSDDSTLVDHESRGPSRARRTRSYSEDAYYPRQSWRDEASREQGQDNSKFATLGKVALAVGIIGGLVWYHEKKLSKEQEYRREKEYRRKRRRDFERAKAARRRDEERWEREQERDDPPSPAEPVRLIEDVPRRSRARSPSRGRKRMEPPPPPSGRSSSRDSVDDPRYDSGRRHHSNPT